MTMLPLLLMLTLLVLLLLLPLLVLLAVPLLPFLVLVLILPLFIWLVSFDFSELSLDQLPLQIDHLLLLLLLVPLGPLLSRLQLELPIQPEGNPILQLQLLASLMLHIPALDTHTLSSVLLLSLPPLQQLILVCPPSSKQPPPLLPQLPSQSIIMKMVLMMTGTWPHLAQWILEMLIMVMQQVTMATMLTIADCKCLTYCRVILKAKTRLMLQSLKIVMSFEDLSICEASRALDFSTSPILKSFFIRVLNFV
jgi:hypothetical protein